MTVKSDVEILFTGLIALVPDSDNLATATKLMMLLIDGTHPELTDVGENGSTKASYRKSLDGAALRRHRPFVRIPFDNVTGIDAPQGGEVIWDLVSTKISFVANAPSPFAMGFSINTSTDINDHTSFQYVSRTDHSLPRPNFIEPACLAVRPSREVAAQVLLTGGRITGWVPQADGAWDVLPKLTGTTGYHGPLAHGIYARYREVAAPYIVLTDMNSGSMKAVALKAGANGKVQIHIANMCDDNPLEWYRNEKPQPDADFRWYYELLSPDAKANALKLITQNPGLPDPTKGLPVPHPSIARGGSGPNCSPRLFLAEKSW